MRTLLKVGAVILLASLPLAGRAAAATDPPTKTPIKHFMVLMQENHSFDNYFGTYPKANGIPSGVCQPVNRLDSSKGCIKPFHLGNRVVEDLNHSHKVAIRQYDHGKMDGFIEQMEHGKPAATVGNPCTLMSARRYHGQPASKPPA